MAGGTLVGTMARHSGVRSLGVLVVAALAFALLPGPASVRAGASTVPAAASNCVHGPISSSMAAELAGVDCPAPHPESPAELLRANDALAVRGAQQGSVLPSAFASAMAEREVLAAQPHFLAGTGGTWVPYGHGPLIGDNARFSRTAGGGYADLGGRVNHFAWDAADHVLFASAGQGGVWFLDPFSHVWYSIGDTLPTQSIGGLAFSTAQGGTLLVTTGNDVFGGGTTFAGLGAYRSVDAGKTWHKATGIPDGVNSFQVAVDPSNPNIVYAATGAGLWRSTDDGASYTNVNLPVSPRGAVPNCNGALPTVEGCFLANIVTDVVVTALGGVGNDTTGGKVVAAVGWRAGSKTNTSQHYASYVESPGNGLYYSADGTPNSFTPQGRTSLPNGFADGEAAKVGRVELGLASGAAQDHHYLYAIVQDATMFQGGAEVAGIDIPGGTGAPVPSNTTLKGIYVSPDLGVTWTRMANAGQLDAPGNGSSLSPGLACTGPSLYCPGVQSWYDMWVKPDPSQATSAGVPTRMMFGLEELWEGVDQTGQGLTGITPFHVLASYTGGTGCLFLVLTFPACPTAASFGTTTLHADHHDGILIPDPDGGVTLFEGTDGGVGTQHVTSGQAFSATNWGRGVNNGFNTLMPYSAVMAKDGTLYAGLQDNGELRTEASGKQFNTHDGDGTTSAVDPNNSNIVFEAPAGAALQKSTDGGGTWTAVAPSDTWQFVNPMAMDPLNANHLLDAGNNVWEAIDGAGSSSSWTNVFALGTAPSGTAWAESAIDLRGKPTGKTFPTGPKTADIKYTDGGSTVPGPAAPNVFAPGTYVDHPFTIGPNDGDAGMSIAVSWPNTTFDWDVYLYQKDSGGNLNLVGQSASTNDPEKIALSNPPAGDYVLRVSNSTASGTFDASVSFTQRTAQVASDLVDAAYVAVCGHCDALNARPFNNGIATNVGGSQPPKALSSQGWHFAKANGLPKRYITSIVSDSADPRTVYVTLAGYSRRWEPVGALGEQPDPRTGHVFKSTDAGDTFTDISGNLPDGPAESVLLYNGQLIVGTDVGVFISSDTAGTHYEVLGSGLPNAPVFSVALKPKGSAAEPDLLYVATHGRGVYTYNFAPAGKVAPPQVIAAAGPVVLPNTARASGIIPLAGGALVLGLLSLLAFAGGRGPWRRGVTNS